MRITLCWVLVLFIFSTAQSQSKLRFVTIENKRVSIDSFYQYSFGAFDSAGHKIAYSLINPPAWVRFDIAQKTTDTYLESFNIYK